MRPSSTSTPAKLPAPEEVNGWTSTQYTDALRHDQSNPAYNQSFRQLLHVGFKVAAKMGPQATFTRSRSQ